MVRWRKVRFFWYLTELKKRINSSSVKAFVPQILLGIFNRAKLACRLLPVP